ncbi:hypothetical protein Tco_1195381 [Tanacetum coccineum]
MAFPHLQELAAAHNSNNLTDAMSSIFKGRSMMIFKFAGRNKEGMMKLGPWTQLLHQLIISIPSSIPATESYGWVVDKKTQILHQLIISIPF